MLKKEYILRDMDCSNSEEAIRMLADVLEKDGAVKDTFCKAVVDREKEYPTGLPAVAFDVAVPHTTDSHVNRPSIAVGFLSKPVMFRQMGSPEIELYPEVILMLAISDPEKQLVLLKKLMVFLQDENALKSLKASSTKDEVYEIVNSYI
ncbi:phosphoenolpyruvate-dependent sugar phosphotransferase system, EIIA 2 [Anaerofustis stercorihominis DSM 17244]|uniref:Phosphoenolpyruvate-dependent sugar phosphotransferase system, EIIA 2 n=1 Tax=Anaerofustis stercorihominis DSM 17244 TaxID=445971 RepID=B1C6X5_9FIRM|nr:PTS sugar transporter subunit IIA [Anaerofustis stercorihominis]EDS72762.1 phosphoenolpyruvate-dependent sugar phosphotransferase system, EIIA 2 [Anaerofustis stercorihominis DSM 17244]